MAAWSHELMGALGVAGAMSWGLATAGGAFWLTSLAGGEQADRWLATESERRRRRNLRSRSRTYRWFEPVVEALAGWNRRTCAAGVERLGAHLDLIGEQAGRPEDFLAIKQVEAGSGALMGALIGLFFVGSPIALLAGLLGYALTLAVVLRSTARQASQHRNRLRQRLPAVVDLMALMLEAGVGTLRECLVKAAEENADHPIGVELRRLLVQTDQGAAPADALREMGRRLNDGDVGELVFALVTAEERGIPLRTTLRDLAAKMRLRQVQWLEKAAEEARVHITWPGLVMTLACLIVVAAPIVFSLVGQ